MTSGNPRFDKALQLFNNNKLEQARKLLKTLTKTEKRNINAWLLLGMTEARSGRYENAAACFRSILHFDPGSADAHYYLGAALEAQGIYDDAIKEYLATLELQPGYLKANYNIGNIYRVLGLPETSERYYRAALQTDPRYVDALSNLGSVLKSQSKLEAANECFLQALKYQPGNARLLTNLGNVDHLLERYSTAIQYYRAALQTDPDLREAILGLSGAQFKNGQKDLALQGLKQALQRLPGDEGIIAALATIHEEDGEYLDAYEALKNSIDNKSSNVEIAIIFGNVSRYLDLTESAVELLERSLDTQLDAHDRLRAYFVLGKLYDQLTDYDRAFDRYSKGNQLKPLKFDRDEFKHKISRIIDTFDSNKMLSASRADNGSDRPVFIVGMPRSGTSLVEQILSSHPDVHGAGELMETGMMVSELSENTSTGSRYPECVSNISDSTLAGMSDRYLKILLSINPSAKRVIDKMPHNFLYLGLIERMFPNARIIHCVRAPMDTCLSCYFTEFLANHSYAYDLSNLGFYYCQYLRLMRHWQSVLKIPMYVVEYESLVNNQEKISRELVDFCGLEWNEKCLDFHNTRRFVNTASYDQVRRPMYKSSIGRAKHYYDKLDALIIALGQCLEVSK